MKRRIVKLAIFALVCLVLCIGALIIKSAVAAKYESQQMAQRWQSGSVNYAQLTYFLPENANHSSEQVQSWRRSIDKVFEEESLTAQSENARLWIDCYSGINQVNIATESASVNARAIVTGGDFFAFHPISLLDGWYYSEDDVMDDSVIIDKNLAWELFGGCDLAGMDVLINGQYCIIAGVCDLPENSAELECYSDKPTVYIPASFMDRIGSQTPVTCYEVVAPEPVKNFAEEKIGSALALEQDQYEFVYNTNRFGFANALQIVSQFGKRAQRTGDIFFPWWENAARFAEDWCALLALLACAALVFPVVFVLGTAVYCIIKRRTVASFAAKYIKKLFKMELNSNKEEEYQ